MAISVAPKARVGARLKEARARRGVSVEDAALHTRIKPRFLRALEADAPPSAFRAPVYARAFLREYAGFLGLDPESLVADYASVHGIGDGQSIRLPRPVERRSHKKLIATLLWIASLGAMGALVVVSARSVERSIPPVTLPAETSPPAAEAAAPAGGENEIVLRLRVKDARTWIRVRVDGELAEDGRRKPGFVKTFRADRRIRLELANAGAVRLRLGGEPLGAPGAEGVTYRATFVLVDGEVQVRRP
ncbi:MAG TPA: RodZ domain-containing protein [Actinomycetota bacterium]